MGYLNESCVFVVIHFIRSLLGFKLPSLSVVTNAAAAHKEVNNFMTVGWVDSVPINMYRVTGPIPHIQLRIQTVLGSAVSLHAPRLTYRVVQQPQSAVHSYVDTLIGLLSDENKGDISQLVAQAAKLLSNSASVRFWRDTVLQTPSYYSGLNSQALATAMFSLCRYEAPNATSA